MVPKITFLFPSNPLWPKDQGQNRNRTILKMLKYTYFIRLGQSMRNLTGHQNKGQLFVEKDNRIQKDDRTYYPQCNIEIKKQKNVFHDSEKK